MDPGERLSLRGPALFVFALDYSQSLAGFSIAHSAKRCKRKIDFLRLLCYGQRKIIQDILSLAVSAPEGGLTETDAARIVDIVNQTTGFTADQIHIIEVE